MVKVYVDDLMSLDIPVSQCSQEQLRHVATTVMMGIHDVFPADDVDSNNPISEKKLIKQEGRFTTPKTLLGFDFDGTAKQCGLRWPNERSY